MKENEHGLILMYSPIICLKGFRKSTKPLLGYVNSGSPIKPENILIHIQNTNHLNALLKRVN